MSEAPAVSRDEEKRGVAHRGMERTTQILDDLLDGLLVPSERLAEIVGQRVEQAQGQLGLLADHPVEVNGFRE